MPWDFYTQDFPENRYSAERYDELCALEIEIALNSDKPETWRDIRCEIHHHFTRHPFRAWAQENDPYFGTVEGWKLRRDGAFREWREHLQTLLELRRIVMRERNGSGEIARTRRSVCEARP